MCQACICAIGWKSRIRFAEGSVSQRQGCPPRGVPHVRDEGSRRQKPAPTNRNYIRRIVVGDAAKQAKARYCAEQRNVYIEEGWAEGTYTYPERSGDNPAKARASTKAETTVRIKNNRWYHQKSAEAIVGRKRAPIKRRGLTKG